MRMRLLKWGHSLRERLDYKRERLDNNMDKAREVSAT
jgi:hypothetical protein